MEEYLTAEKAMERAVESDHPCEDETACDIAAALRAGFPFVAAHLLSGATECPAVDAVYNLFRIRWEDGWPNEWEAWTEWFKEHTVQCPSCDTFNFTDVYYPDICGNCHQDLPKESDEEEDLSSG